MIAEEIFASLSDQERQLVEKLSAVVDIVGEIYRRQKNPNYPAGNLYPPDMTREELDQAAIRVPGLKRFDTVVERGSATSQFKAIPYNFKYPGEYARIRKLLVAALPLTRDASFKHYLQELTKCLDTGTTEAYWQMMTAWIQTKNYPITFPFTYDEAYMDHLFGIKGGFNAGVFIPDRDFTSRMRKFIDTTAAFQQTLVFPEPPKVFPNLHTAVYQTVNHQGMLAEMELRAWNLPNDARVREAVGARQIIIKESVEHQFQARLLPLMTRLLPRLVQAIGPADLLFGLFLAKVLHELSHNIGYYASELKLEKYFWIFEELRAYVIPVVWTDYLKRQGIMSPNQQAAVIMMTLASELIDIVLAEKISTRDSYRTAAVIHFNYLCQGGGIKMRGSQLDLVMSRFIPTAKRLFAETAALTARGNFQRAREYTVKYGQLEPLAPILPILRQIVKSHE